ncbi:ATPase [Sporomusaceae bacterium FL31]|nr:ATPase [Sporomusaceae bacterium FL31]GCE35344.1 ATPase [Sporomusaceae bacterium]
MNSISVWVLCSSIGTVSMILVYIYLYMSYRERFMGLWAVTWIVLLSRYLLFDTGLLPWKQSLIGLTTYQLLIFISILMFAWGTCLFINKPFNKLWLYITAILFFVTVVLNVLSSSLIYKLILPIFYGCYVCIWLGLIFIRLKLPGYGHLITGYSFILWSILNFLAPFSLGGAWFLPWSFTIGGLLRLAIAIGTLMVYLEKTRTDLVMNESKYRLLAENAVDVIYHYQLLPEEKLQYISPSVLTLTGYTPEEYYADNKVAVSLIHPDDYSTFDNFIKNWPKSAEIPLTLRLVRKTQTILWLEQKCIPLYDENGQIVALEGIIRDITMRKNMEQMTAMIDRMNMVGNMAATVAHEIRNPMTTVHGYLQVMQTREKYRDDKDKFELMIAELDRANTIIREYLSLSRERVPNFKTCSLNNIIETLFPLIQADAISSKVKVHLDLGNIPELLLDENEIRQLLLNFVRNGIEAMPQGGNVIVRTILNDSNIILSISDQGTGIPPHLLEQLGTPFITTKDSGTGLGLPLCYQIAKRHNATIKFDTGEEGTTVFICFS